jgi:hypothetical protein
MGPRQVTMISEQINEQGSRFNLKGLGGVVDGKSYFHEEE